MLNVVKTRNVWFIISGLITAVGIIALLVYGLNLGIDFKGGSLIEVKFLQNAPEPVEVQDYLSNQGYGTAQVQHAGSGAVSIKTTDLSQEAHDQLILDLSTRFGQLEELRFNKIGPTLSAEIAKRASYQLILVVIGILLYISWAFRRVPKPLSSWRFGWAAIIALIHDLFVVIGVFAILGHFLDVELDALFVTALLTVLGFSVHDTIIVFDRIRENLRKFSSSFENVVSNSINQTLVRSINTSSTVVFVLLALLLFGGQSIRYFTLALLIGVVAGAYSSIFLATPLVYVMHKKRFR